MAPWEPQLMNQVLSGAKKTVLICAQGFIPQEKSPLSEPPAMARLPRQPEALPDAIPGAQVHGIARPVPNGPERVFGIMTVPKIPGAFFLSPFSGILSPRPGNMSRLPQIVLNRD
jgi:hypothetical protein